MKKTQSISVIIVVIIVAFALLKAFVLNNPKETPQQITQNIIEFIQDDNSSEDDKSNIREYYKPEALDKFDTTTDDSSSSDEPSDVVVTIKSVEENKDKATATLEFSAWVVTMPIQLKFEKEGNFFSGYRWLIVDVIGIDCGNSDVSTKESTVGPNEKADIGGDFFITVSAPSDHNPTDSWSKAEDGYKYVAVEITYFNESDNSDTVDPSNLSLRDSEGHSYSQAYMSTKEPALEYGTTVTSGSSAKGYVTYEVPTTANITSAIYANSASVVTINF